VLLNPTAPQTISGQPLTINSGLSLAGSALSNAIATGASSGNTITLLNAQANAAAVTGTGSAVVLYTYSLPANTVATLKGIRVRTGYVHSTGSALVAYTLTLNGVAIVPNQSLSGNSGQGAIIDVTVLNTGATTGTMFDEWFDGSLNQIVTINTAAATGLAWGSNQTLQFTFNVAATDKVTPIFWLVELIL
jgi:hypothetical protein